MNLIYVLCYDDNTESIAKKIYKSYEWSRILRLPPSNIYLESIMYKGKMMELEDEWKDKKYVGTISWKFFKKSDLPLLNQIIMNAENYDFIKLIKSSKDGHWHDPQMEKITIEFSSRLGISIPKNHMWFFCNYWCSTPSFMREYCKWFQSTVVPAVDLYPVLKEKCVYETGVLTPEECLVNIGVPYYPYLPFICERLISLYLSKKPSLKVNQFKRPVK